MDEETFRALVRFVVKEARKITDDQEALEVKCLYKQWEKQMGKAVEVGEYIQYEDKLYRVLQTHIIQETWIPGVGTESLYVVIDKEHAGTIGDPIPFVVNMEVFNGKYYTEDGILYLCIRDSGIALQNKASELVNNYFSIVNLELGGTEEIPTEPDNGDSTDTPIEGDNTEENPSEGGNTGEEVEPNPPVEPEPIPSEEGTLDNPIDVTSVALPITYELDKYYKENGSVYKCTRAETLHFYPSALVGHYFEII